MRANCKRDAKNADIEASSSSFTPPKRTRHGDSVNFDDVFGSTSTAIEVSPAPSSAGENDDQSSSVCSCCSSNERDEIAKDELIFVNQEIFETEISKCITNNFSEERTPASEIVGEMVEMDSKSVAARRGRRRPAKASKRLTEAEIEEFFSGAEKYEQKRFAEKYNYDVVKDTPLEGRYQWVRLKP